MPLLLRDRRTLFSASSVLYSSSSSRHSASSTPILQLHATLQHYHTPPLQPMSTPPAPAHPQKPTRKPPIRPITSRAGPARPPYGRTACRTAVRPHGTPRQRSPPPAEPSASTPKQTRALRVYQLKKDSIDRPRPRRGSRARAGGEGARTGGKPQRSHHATRDAETGRYGLHSVGKQTENLSGVMTHRPRGASGPPPSPQHGTHAANAELRPADRHTARPQKQARCASNS